MNKMKKWKVIVSVLLVFLLGSLSGVLVTYKHYQHRIADIMKDEPGAMREMIIERLHHKLNLDARQLEQLRVIVKETHDEIKAVRKQFRPQIEEILEQSRNRVRTILRQDQLEKYEKIIAERKKIHEDKEKSE